MKLYTENGYSYFYDRYQRHWVLYPVDSEGNRIEHDKFGNPIESEYFINKSDLKNKIKSN